MDTDPEQCFHNEEEFGGCTDSGKGFLDSRNSVCEASDSRLSILPIKLCILKICLSQTQANYLWHFPFSIRLARACRYLKNKIQIPWMGKALEGLQILTQLAGRQLSTALHTSLLPDRRTSHLLIGQCPTHQNASVSYTCEIPLMLWYQHWLSLFSSPPLDWDYFFLFAFIPFVNTSIAYCHTSHIWICRVHARMFVI